MNVGDMVMVLEVEVVINGLMVVLGNGRYVWYLLVVVGGAVDGAGVVVVVMLVDEIV